MVFNIETSMVPLQSHVQHNCFFEMVHPSSGNIPAPSHCRLIPKFNQPRYHHFQSVEDVSGNQLQDPQLVIQTQAQWGEVLPDAQSNNIKYIPYLERESVQ